MAVLKCSVCGGMLHNTDEEDIYVCANCGLRQTLPQPEPEAPPAVSHEQMEFYYEINALLERIAMLLSDREWFMAMERCDQILDKNPSCGDAYLYRAMAALQISTREHLLDPRYSHTRLLNPDFNRALHFGFAEKEEYLAQLQQIREAAAEAARQRHIHECNETYLPAQAALEKARATTNAAEKKEWYRKARTLLRKTPDYEDSNRLIEECDAALAQISPDEVRAAQQKKITEDMYALAIANMEEGSVRSLEKAIERFGKLTGYQDSDQRLAQCKEQLDVLLAPIRAEQEAMERQAAEAAEKRRQMEAWQAACRQNRRCQHCGGSFKGFWTPVCQSCGKQKDY